MVLIPVDDTGFGSLLDEFIKGNADTHGFESDFFSRIGDAKHGYAVARNMAQIPKGGKRVALSVETGHHLQAGWTTIHRIELPGEGKSTHTSVR